MPQTFSRFFVTRQSANILQDLLRRCEQAGSISVLYGVKGVGKSRLLAQFAHNPGATEKCFHICLDQNRGFYPVGKADSAQPLDDLVQSLLQRLPAGSVLLIDQYERMPAPVNRDVLDFWLRTAQDKNLKLVVALQSGRLPAFEQSLEGMPLAVESVELKALNERDRLEFVRVHCCPGAAQSIIVSAGLKNALKASEGLFPALQKLLQLQRDEFKCRDNVRATHGLKKRWITVVLLILLSAGTMLVLKNQILPEMSPVVARQLVQSAQPMLATVHEQTKSTAVQETPVEALPPQRPLENGPVLPVSSVEQMTREVDETATESAQPVVKESAEAVHKIQHNPVLVDAVAQRQDAARQWLMQAPGNASSIQIMTLNASDDTHRSLLAYLAKLTSAGIDVDQIMIFPFWRGSREMTGVLYGRYEDSTSARRQLSNLPLALKADRPMVRTVAGIRRHQQPEQN